MDCNLDFLFLLDLPLFILLSAIYYYEFRSILLLPMFALGTWKAGIGMSVCLHRFFSHRGFQCSRPMVWVLYLIACQAGQGPPLWWASKHHRHHRYCDTARDPHSPSVIGLRACLFWMYTKDGLFGTATKDLEYPELVYVDNVAYLLGSIPHVLVYYYFGIAYAIFVSLASGVLCNVLTQYLNLVLHTTTKGTSICNATDVPFSIANVVGEAYHEWHHKHPCAYKRPGLDIPYYTFILPLSVLGLIWKPIIK
jgi:stearoyl-CoA desaturase (delta-9 desaturase)